MEATNHIEKTSQHTIPEGWRVFSLGELGEVKMCKRVMKYQTLASGEIPFYKIGTFGGTPDAYISRDLFTDFRSRFSYPKKGDILLSAAGTIGRTVVFDGEESYFQDSNIVWIDNKEDKVLNSLLYYCYQVMKFHTENGGIVVRLYNENLRNTTFCAPESLGEQKRITEALTAIDKIIGALDEAIAKKRQIKDGLMQQLLTGKTRLPGFNEEWRSCKLKDIAEMYSGGTPSSKEPKFYGGDIPFLSISDMTSSGKYICTTEKTITKMGLENSSARVFPVGTLMYAMYASLGKCSISQIETAISQAILGFILSDEIDKMYLYYHFCFIEEQVKNMGQTGTQSNLSKALVEQFTIPVPIFSEQRAIADVLSTIDDDIYEIELKREKYLSIKQGMMQELLTGKTRI